MLLSNLLILGACGSHDLLCLTENGKGVRMHAKNGSGITLHENVMIPVSLLALRKQVASSSVQSRKWV